MISAAGRSAGHGSRTHVASSPETPGRFIPVVGEKLEMNFTVGEAGIVGAVVDHNDYPRIYFYEKQ
jgi:hypothetical protein